MATTTHAGGRLRVTAPDDWTIASAPPAAVRRTRGGGGRRGARAAPSDQASQAALETALLDALASQDFDRVDTLDLTSAPPRATPRRRVRTRGPTPAPGATVELDVEHNEDAVVLLEQDGFYTWVFPQPARAAPRTRLRGGPSAAPAKRTLTFLLNVEPGTAAPAARKMRGIIKKLIFGPSEGIRLQVCGSPRR